MSHLRFLNKAHEVSSKLFLRVAQLCHIFAYRTRHTKCVVSYFLGSLTYVRSSVTEQGTRSVQRVIYSGRSLMSDLRLQNKDNAVCSKLFLLVAQLCHIFAYGTRHTRCVVSYFFGSLTYFRSLVTEQGTRCVQYKVISSFANLFQIFAYRTRHTKCVVSCFLGSLSYVRSSLTEQGTRSVQ